jgi:hypothetical protein
MWKINLWPRRAYRGHKGAECVFGNVCAAVHLLGSVPFDAAAIESIAGGERSVKTTHPFLGMTDLSIMTLVPCPTGKLIYVINTQGERIAT